MARQVLEAVEDEAVPNGKPVSKEEAVVMYGCLVMQLMRDHKDVEVVNRKLDNTGYIIGVRSVLDFPEKSKVKPCANLKEAAEMILKAEIKICLGPSVRVGNWSADEKSFGVIYEENPLAGFMELPEEWGGLWYSNMMCGMIRGMLDMANVKVDCCFVKDCMRGDDVNEIRVSLPENPVEEAAKGGD
eukprot:GFKZ01010067.1.p1 GENE.GFKZ01010067.1~~GFKZ01010067.1.p1  ORF type:complete len:187 (-),score=42.48 GFKZ01010067.1:201-761(-)